MNPSEVGFCPLLKYCALSTLGQKITMKDKKEAKNACVERYVQGDSEEKDEQFSRIARAMIEQLTNISFSYQEQTLNNMRMSWVGGNEKKQLQEKKFALQAEIQKVRNLFALTYQYDYDSVANCFAFIRSETEKRVSAESAFLIPLEQQAYLQKFRRKEELSFLSSQELSNLLQECAKEQQLVDSIQGQLQEMLTLAKRNDPIEIKHVGDTPFCAMIRTPHAILGYSVYVLCKSLGIAKIRLYSGELEFPLTGNDLVCLQKHLRNMIEKAEVFSNFLSMILRGETGEYIELGQKKIREVIRDQEIVNKRKREEWDAKTEHDPIALSPLGLMKLKGCLTDEADDPYFLLFSQISLNLTNHPEKEVFKALFESWYREEGMVARNGQPKTFQINDPYRSALDGLQIMQVVPRMKVYLQYRDLFGTHLFHPQEQIVLLEQVLKYNAFEMACKIAPLFGDSVNYHWKEIWNKTLQEANRQSGKTELSKVELYQETLYKIIISHYFELCSPLPEIVYEPSEEEISNLYEGNIYTIYQGNQQHKDVRRLFTSLKDSLGIRRQSEESKEANHSLNCYYEGLLVLEEELITRLNGYSRLARKGTFGQEQIDAAVDYFERYVTAIVYRERSGVTQESIEQSLIKVIGRQGQDMRGGCGKGLAGRFLDFWSTLSQNSGKDLDSAIRQFKSTCLQEAFDQSYLLNSYGESSMKVREKEWVAALLNIRPNTILSHNRDDALLAQTMNQCHPLSIAREAMQFFCSTFNVMRSEREREEEIYSLLMELGFPIEREILDKKYRKEGNPEMGWDYTRFKQDLPGHLIPYLVKKGHWRLKSECIPTNQMTLCLADGQKITQPIAAPHLALKCFWNCEDKQEMDESELELKRALEGYENFSGWINNSI